MAKFGWYEEWKFESGVQEHPNVKEPGGISPLSWEITCLKVNSDLFIWTTFLDTKEKKGELRNQSDDIYHSTDKSIITDRWK